MKCIWKVDWFFGSMSFIVGKKMIVSLGNQKRNNK